MKRMMVGVLVCASLMVACSQNSIGNQAEAEDPTENEEVTAASILEGAKQAHEDIQSLEVSMKERNQFDQTENATLSYQFDNGVVYYENELFNEKIYKDSEETMIVNEYIQLTNKEEQLRERYIDKKTEEHQNPLAYYQQFDDAFFDLFELSEREDFYVLTYIGEEESQKALVEGFADSFIAYSAQITDTDLEESTVNEPEISSFSLSFDIDKDTSMIKGYEIRSSFTIDVNGFENDYDFDGTYLLANANEDVTIDKPDQDEMAVGNLSFDEQEQFEQEAFDYVDAVIQANIYQNVDEYVERAPTGSEEEKREAGDAEQQSFVELYTMALAVDMEEFGVEEEKLMELSEAMLSGYSKSEYMILDSKAIAEDTFHVTVSIQGLSQIDLSRELDLVLTEKMMNGEITEDSSGDEVADAFIDSLDTIYDQNISLNEPRDVIVEVNRAGGGYMILDYTSYIDGFINGY